MKPMHHHKHTDPNHMDHSHMDQMHSNKTAFLDSPQRTRLISPEVLIGQMPIQDGHILLDIGAGSGFFTIPMAERTSNKVFAMDPDSHMLSLIEDKAKEKGLANIHLIHESIETISLQNNSVDFVMASLILHEVRSLTIALTNIHAVLKPGGHLLCLEYEKDDDILEGPPMSIRIGSEALEEALSSIGFGVLGKTRLGPAIYTVLAVKRDKDPAANHCA